MINLVINVAISHTLNTRFLGTGLILNQAIILQIGECDSDRGNRHHNKSRFFSLY